VRGCGVSNCLEYSWHPFLHVTVGEANYSVALTLQPRSSALVIGLLVGMRMAVKFDDELVFSAEEIHDVIANGLLAAKFQAVQLTIAQLCP
jgi:hypothetical protein